MKNFTKFWFGLVALLMLPFSNFADIPVGTGTEASATMPVSAYYQYSYSQVIYLQSEINAAGTITTLSWYFNGSSLANSNDWTVYMGHTSNSTFGYGGDWVPAVSMTEVWNGAFTSPSGPGWLTLDITDFAYNNTDNLVIAVDENKVNYDGSSESFNCTPLYYITRGLVYYSDYTNPDPSNPPSGILQYSYANIILGGINLPCPAPTNQSISVITFTTADLDWTENGSATSWEIEYGPKGFWPGSGTIVTTGTKPYPLSGLSQGTNYDWRIRSVCDGGLYSSQTGPQTFVTLCDAYTLPYFENFDGVIWPLTAPPCTTIENIDLYNTWEVYSYYNYYSPPRSLGIYNGYIEDDDWFYIPGLQLTGGTSYLIQFKYTSSSLTESQKLEVKWGNEANSAFMINGPVFNDENINYNGTFHDGIATFVPPADGIYYVGFNAYSEPNNAYLFVDDVSVIPTPTCPPPYALSAADISANSALLGWSDLGGGSFWNIEYGDEGFAPGTGTSVNGISNPYYLGSLIASHTYDFYVQSDCGGSQSTWVGPISFTTLCDPLSVPFYENFDAISPPSLPPCMAMENIYDDWAYWRTSSWLAYSAPNNISIGSGYPNLNDWFILPGLELTAGTTYLLEFMYTSSSPELEKLEVKWGDEPISTTMTLGTIFNDAGFYFNGVYHKGTGAFTPSANGIYYLGFHGYSDSNKAGISVDDISVTTAASCLCPVGLNATDVLIESANLGWIEIGNATAWNIEFGDAGFTPGTGTIINVITNPYNLNGLAANHSYDFYVQSDCGIEQSAWSMPFTFKTLCSASSVPYFENFNAASPPALPECASFENPGGGYAHWTTSNYDPYSSPYNLYLFASSSLLDDWFYTPGLQLTGDTRYTVELKYRGFANTTQIEVKWGSAPYASNMTNGPVFSDPEIHSPNSNYITGIGTFIPPLDGIYYIGFHATSNRDFVSLYVDDISVSESPACPAPTGIVVSDITYGSAHITWTELGEATSWNIEYGDTGYIPGTGTLITGVTNPFDLTGLLPYHPYDIYVQADCGGGQSSWSLPATITTLCSPITAPYEQHFDAQTIPACWRSEGLMTWDFINNWPEIPWIAHDHTGNGGSIAAVRGFTLYQKSDITLQSPAFDISSLIIPQLRFFLYNNNDYGLGDWQTLRVDLWNGTAWIDSIYYWGADMNIPEWVEVEIPLNTYTLTGNIQFRFVVDIGGGMEWRDPMIIDDVYIEEIPGCPHPTNLIVKTVTANSADLDWTSYSGISDIDYGTPGHLPGTGTIVSGVSSLYTLSPLAGNTDYTFYVRDQCSGGGHSNWSWFNTFTTLCDAASVPYLENFDGVANEWGFPDCMSSENIEGYYQWQIGTVGFYSSPYMISIPGNWDPMNDWFFTQGLELTGGTSYMLEFKYSSFSATAIDKLEVRWGNAPFSIDMINGTLFNDPNIQYNNEYHDGAGFIIPPSDGIYFIGFHGYSDANSSGISVDDISVNVAPNCPAPIGLTVSDILTQSASLSWTELGTATSWNVEYGDAGFAQGTGTLITGVSNPYTLTGLFPSRSYGFFVQSDCGSEQSVWRGQKFFTTACDVTPIPYTENFLAYHFPSCWTQTYEGGLYSDVWSTWNSSYSGGEPCEMIAQYQWSSGISRLISPAINTSGYSEVFLSFLQGYNANSYYGTAPVIKIQSSSDMVNWSDEWSIQSNINFWETRVVQIMNNLGPITYLAWVIDGDHSGFNFWFFDDVSVYGTPLAFNQWNGTISSDWFNPGNWSDNLVSGASTDALIPVVTLPSVYPVIAGSGAETNLLNIASNASLTISTEGNLTTHGLCTNYGSLEIQSNLMGNAGSFIDLAGTAGNGTYHFYRDVLGTGPQLDPEGWHYISMPVNGITSDILIPDYYLNYWNEAGNTWVHVEGGPDPCQAVVYSFENGTGYSVKRALDYSCPNPIGNVVDFGGNGMIPNNWAQVHNSSGIYSANFTSGAGSGWNLFGNPYSSPVDNALMVSDVSFPPSLNGAVYLYNDAVLDYEEWAAGVGPAQIPATQGFFLQATGTGSLTFNSAWRTHTGQANYYKDEIKDLVEINATGNGKTDRLFIRFLDEASSDFDRMYDAHKMISKAADVPQIYTSSGGNDLAINTLPKTSMLPMGFKAGISGNYTIEAADASDFAYLILEDIATGKKQDLLEQSYPFSYVAGETPSRFNLYFGLIDDPDNNGNIQIWSGDHRVYVSVPESATGDILIYNLMGQEITQKEITPGINIINVDHVNTYYIVKVVTGDTVTTNKVYIR